MLTSLDWIVLVVLGLSAVMGAWRGLVYEVLSLLGWVVSFYAAQWFAPQAAALRTLASFSEPVRYAVAFVLIFVAALFAWGLLAFVVKKFVEAIGLRPIDRILGALFGVARGMILLLAMTAVIRLTAMNTSSWWADAAAAPWLAAALQATMPLLPEKFAAYLG